VGSASGEWFSGNGVNQRWSSNATVDFSGTDKVTVWAGVQRLSNAARGTIAELTASIASNDGAFHLTGPNAASDTFGWESKGTTLRDAVATSALSARRSIVGVGDISGDLARLIVDGTVTDNTGDQGSGNYSNATLNVFSRGGSSQFFNGRLYSLIIAGGLYDSRTVSAIQRLHAQATEIDHSMNLTIIVPDADIAAVRSALADAGFGPNNISVPMRGSVRVESPDQATHWGTSWWTLDDGERITAIVRDNSADALIVSDVELDGVSAVAPGYGFEQFDSRGRRLHFRPS
jgi:hypothetical protein